jgi:hypothetical protein
VRSPSAPLSSGPAGSARAATARPGPLPARLRTGRSALSIRASDRSESPDTLPYCHDGCRSTLRRGEPPFSHDAESRGSAGVYGKRANPALRLLRRQMRAFTPNVTMHKYTTCALTGHRRLRKEHCALRRGARGIHTAIAQRRWVGAPGSPAARVRCRAAIVAPVAWPQPGAQPWPPLRRGPWPAQCQAPSCSS